MTVERMSLHSGVWRWAAAACLALVVLASRMAVASPISLLEAPQVAGWPSPAGITSDSWAVVELSTGQVLAGQGLDQPVGIAPLLQLLAVRSILKDGLQRQGLRPEDRVPTPEDDRVPPGPRLFLAGEPASVEVLLQGVLLMGAQDALMALAEAHDARYQEGPSFLQTLRDQVQELQLTGTRLTGLSGAEAALGQTSLRDLALLSSRLVEEFPAVLSRASQPRLEHRGLVHPNPNPLIKTDPTVRGLLASGDRVQPFLIALSERDRPLGPQRRVPRRVMAVVTGAETFEQATRETTALLSYAFRFFDLLELQPAGPVAGSLRVYRGSHREAALSMPRPLRVAVPRGTEKRLGMDLLLPQALIAPIPAGQPVGQARALLDGQPIALAPVETRTPIRLGGLLARALDGVRLMLLPEPLSTIRPQETPP